MASRTPPHPPGGLDRDDSSKSADAYRTISEVAVELRLPQHVLRFWETRFSQIRPLKRAGGRRFYRPEDIALLRAVQSLLYDEGYTIKGVQRLLTEFGARHVAEAHARSRDRSAKSSNADGLAGSRSGPPGDSAVGQAGEDGLIGRTPGLPRSGESASGGRPTPSRDDWIEGLNAVLDELHECARLIASVRAREA